MRYLKTTIIHYNNDVDSDGQRWSVQRLAYLPENLAKRCKCVTLEGKEWFVNTVEGKRMLARNIPKPHKPSKAVGK